MARVDINDNNQSFNIDKVTFRPHMLKEMEQQVIWIRKNVKIAQDRQNRYANMKRTPREFKVGDHVCL
jgi:hypothetical protein